MGQHTIGDVTATDISTHLDEMAQLNAQNQELFERLREILDPEELSDFLLQSLGLDTDAEIV